MASGSQNQERLPMNLRKQLALSVRSIQWSYGIFWSISATQPGVLEWGDGYYNGDIKTRKTVQSLELNADQLSLQRSEQLRELYESLSAGESSPQARRPSAALSPEDLTDTEWYYLVCMSYVFDVGQGLPGRALLSGQPIWLCNAQSAQSKVFSRSLVAKTVVCFPFAGGVIEFGVTDLVSKDLSLIHRIKSLFLDTPQTIVPNKSILVHNKDFACPALEPHTLGTGFGPVLGCEQLEMVSPYNSSDGIEPNLPAENPYIIGGKNSGASQSQVRSWQCMDDHHSLNSSDCVSQNLVDHDHADVVPLCQAENGYDIGSQDVRECNQTKLTTSNPVNDYLHYRKVLSALLKSSHLLILGAHFRNSDMESGFVSWKKDCLVTSRKEKDGTPQKLLKKILFQVPRMHDKRWLQSPQDDAVGDAAWRPEANEICGNRVLLERRRRGKMNERFTILKSLVPSNSKADKVSILDGTIEYLRDLVQRVEELESCRELTESETRPEKKLRDHVEQTSDNYGNNNVTNGKKPSYLHKRKTCEDIDHVASKDFSIDNLTVSMNNKDFLIKFRCRWRDGILFEIMDVLNVLDLDCHSVQSSTIDGVLSMTIHSKCKGSSVAKPGTVRRALQRTLLMFL
ncbi:hypothetical protein V6N13_145925 [Hibiscus sabdariffa]|uniref:BHLH domain-containing protein n=1 Tax=Hibiscus sabdariffa TaxID=183260 RepID=A0ABR2TRX9_9ROSI